MREEVESIVAEQGWSKESLQKMRKVDSFIKESMRMDGLSCCTSCLPWFLVEVLILA